MTGDTGYADRVIDGFLLQCDFMSQSPTDDQAFMLESAAIAYDWLNDRIVARGLKSQMINLMKTVYAEISDPNYLEDSIRESDYHNYMTEIENSFLQAGLALYGD